MAKKKSKKSLIFRLAFIAFSVYVVVSFVVMQLDIAKRKELLQAEQEKLQEQEYIKKEITSMLNSGENVEYLMKIAREKLGFVFPDEEVYIDFDRK